MPVKKTRSKIYTGKHDFLIKGMSEKHVYLLEHFSRVDGSEAAVIEDALELYNEHKLKPFHAQNVINFAEGHAERVKEAAIIQGEYQPEPD